MERTLEVARGVDIEGTVSTRRTRYPIADIRGNKVENVEFDIMLLLLFDRGERGLGSRCWV